MKRIKLTRGSARVDDNCCSETVEALNKMSALAYKASSDLKTIKIPKVEKDTVVLINRSGIVQSQKALKVFLKNQTIEGVEIPAGFEVWIPGAWDENIIGQFTANPSIEIPAFKMNEILRTIYIRKL